MKPYSWIVSLKYSMCSIADNLIILWNIDLLR